MSVVRGASLRGPLELDADVVVVGSGAGGAVVATELALSGLSVVVIEEGKHVPAELHGRMRPSESLRHIWRDGGMSVAFGLGGAPTVNVTAASCVGGSSMVTGGVCFRVPELVADEWSRELALDELTAKGLDSYYSRVEKAIHVEEVPVSMRSRSTVLFSLGADKLGHPLLPTRRNTRGCNGCGRCNFGCPHSAKLSVDLSYLPRAMHAGAQIFSDCIVERVMMRGRRAIGVSGRLRNGPDRRPKDRFVVRAKVVVVACGGMYTPLLLKSSGLAGFGSPIGRNLTLHPGFRVFARFDEEVRGWKGAMQSAYSDAFEHERVTLMSLFIPGSVIAATMPGAGLEHARRSEQLAHIAVFGGMVHDDGPGVVRRGLGREPIVTYRMSERDKRAMYFVIRKLAETFFAAGAREVFLPILGQRPLDADAFRRFELERIPAHRIESGSQHPLGSCRMGVSAGDSGVDPDGKLWETDNLFVADGSVLPTSLGVNPQLTIMAMATRIAFKLRDRYRSLSSAA